MKTGIIGAGALGSLFAYRFAKTGNPPVICEKDKNTAAALARGLTCEGPDMSPDAIEIPSVGTSPALLQGCDIVFIFVKSHVTAEAIGAVAPFLGPDTTVVTLQNGLGNLDAITGHISKKNIIYGTTTTGATKIDAGTVRFGGAGTITIGGREKMRLQRVRALLEEAGFSVVETETPDRAIWEKAVINAAINPLGALLEVPNGLLEKNPESKKIMTSIIEEAVSAARARGVSLEAGEMIEKTMAVCRNTSSNLCSMLQDMRAKRKTEIESINGTILRWGEEKGLQLPTNQTIVSLIRARETFY